MNTNSQLITDISDEELSQISHTITYKQIAAYVAAKYADGVANRSLFQFGKDSSPTAETIALLDKYDYTCIVLIWRAVRLVEAIPRLNTFNAVTKLSEAGFGVKFSEDNNALTFTKDKAEFQAPITNGTVNIGAKTDGLIDALDGKFTVSLDFPFASSLAIVIGSLFSIQNGALKEVTFDEHNFVSSGLSAIFDRTMMDANMAVIKIDVQTLLRRFRPQSFGNEDGAKPTLQGNAFCSAIYEVIMDSLKFDNDNSVLPQKRGVFRICRMITLSSSATKVRDLDGNVIDQKLLFAGDTLRFTPAPCVFPVSIGQKRLDWTCGSVQSLSTAMGILSKCRAVRGADDNEKSALARMAYAGVILSTAITDLLYLMANIGRFIRGYRTLILWDDNGKQMKSVLHAVKLIIPSDSDFLVVGYVPADVKKKLDAVVDPDDKTKITYYVAGTRIEVLASAPELFFSRDPTPYEVVYDARHLVAGNWDGESKHNDFESTVADAHLVRMTGWVGLAKGRHIFGRIPFCNYQVRYQTSKALADHKRLAEALKKYDDLCEAVTKVSNKKAEQFNVASGVELHNLVGWEYHGIHPEPGFIKEGEWWYDLSTFNEMILASMICNMSRIQWSYTRRTPNARLLSKGMKYPFIPRDYVARIAVASTLFDFQDIAYEEYEGKTEEELSVMFGHLEENDQAIMISTIMAHRGRDEPKRGNGDNVAGAVAGSNLNDLFANANIPVAIADGMV